MLVNEQIFVSLLSVAAGAGIGAAAAALFVPLIQIAYAAEQQMVPLRLVLEAGDCARLFGVVGAVMGICLCVLGALGGAAQDRAGAEAGGGCVMMQEMLQAKGVSRAFPAPGGGEFWALRGIDLSAPAGKLTILKGRSGSGKTTLLNILSALDPPTAGEVILDGREITALSDRERTALRPHAGGVCVPVRGR